MARTTGTCIFFHYFFWSTIVLHERKAAEKCKQHRLSDWGELLGDRHKRIIIRQGISGNNIILFVYLRRIEVEATYVGQELNCAVPLGKKMLHGL